VPVTPEQVSSALDGTVAIVGVTDIDRRTSDYLHAYT
jgi:hypothetical protein